MKYWIVATLLACASSVWAAPEWTRGVIVKVDPARAQVLLSHQRIKSIGMDAMTMPFKVAEGVALTSFKPGDPVRFTVKEKNDHLVIDAMERSP
jgi:Cu/Ag efflux protein CusF